MTSMMTHAPGLRKPTMTEAQIRRALKRNGRLGRRPWSLYQIAQMKACHRSIMTRAVKTPRRYPEARAFIESLLKNGDAA